MREWWPVRARRAWALLAPTRIPRARSLVHWLLCEFDGMVLDQRDLLAFVARKDGHPTGPLIETLRTLAREGLIRRARIGDRTVLWLPEELTDVPDDRSDR